MGISSCTTSVVLLIFILYALKMVAEVTETCRCCNKRRIAEYAFLGSYMNENFVIVYCSFFHFISRVIYYSDVQFGFSSILTRQSCYTLKK